MRDKIGEIEAAGGQVLVVDPHETHRVRHMLRSVKKDGEALAYPVLADPAVTVSATYGVAFQMRVHTEWSNRPATFIIDRKGVIRYARLGTTYGDRPRPADIVKELEKLSGKAGVER